MRTRKLDDNWLVLEDFGKPHYENFSVLLNAKDIELKEDISVLGFKLSIKVYWFRYNWRKNECENLSCMCSRLTINISEEEMISLTLWQYLSETKSRDDILHCFKNNKVLIALVDKYINKFVKLFNRIATQRNAVEVICKLSTNNIGSIQIPEHKTIFNSDTIKSCIDKQKPINSKNVTDNVDIIYRHLRDCIFTAVPEDVYETLPEELKDSPYIVECEKKTIGQDTDNSEVITDLETAIRAIKESYPIIVSKEVYDNIPTLIKQTNANNIKVVGSEE